MTTTSSIRRHVASPPGLLLICGGLIIIGSLGTWISTPLGNVSGADGVVGWLGAFLGALVAGWSALNLSRPQVQVALAPVAAIIGVGGVLTAFALWSTLQAFGPASWLWNKLVASSNSTKQFGNVHVSTGWGLYLLFIVSLAMTALALAVTSGRVWSRIQRPSGDSGHSLVPPQQPGVPAKVSPASVPEDPLV